jgi:hypothetical protein
MRLPWRREAKQIDSRPISIKALELETAKEKDGLWPATSAWGVAMGRSFESVLM